MMYRSGWATKEGQNRILAIEISKEGFFDLLDEGILTTFDHSFKTEDRWREALNKSKDQDPIGS